MNVVMEEYDSFVTQREAEKVLMTSSGFGLIENGRKLRYTLWKDFGYMYSHLPNIWPDVLSNSNK